LFYYPDLVAFVNEESILLMDSPIVDNLLMSSGRRSLTLAMAMLPRDVDPFGFYPIKNVENVPDL